MEFFRKPSLANATNSCHQLSPFPLIPLRIQNMIQQWYDSSFFLKSSGAGKMLRSDGTICWRGKFWSKLNFLPKFKRGERGCHRHHPIFLHTSYDQLTKYLENWIFFWIFLSETQMTLLVSMENVYNENMYREKSTECTCSMERKYKFRDGLDSRFRKLFGRLWNVAANFSQLFPEESHLWQICENWVQNKRWGDLPVKMGKTWEKQPLRFLVCGL